MTVLETLVRSMDKLNGMFSLGRLSTSVEPRLNLGQTGPNALGDQYTQGLMNAYYRYIARPALRIEEMKYFDFLERELSDVPKALDAYATMASTGTLTGQSRGTFAFRYPDNTPESLTKWMDPLLKVIQRHAFTLARGMCQYGSYPVEALIDEVSPGRVGVVDINHIPPATMFRNVDRGTSSDQNYWTQVVKGVKKATLERWRIVHFAVWNKVVDAEETKIYGTSLLQPVGRIGLQLASVIDGMVVGRLTRAALRMAYGIDISDIPGDDAKILERLDLYQDKMGAQRQFFSDDTTQKYGRAPIPDENIWFPAGKNLAFDVKPIQGDSNLSNIKDVELLTRFYFGAIGVPPEYLGHQRSQGGRSVLSQIDINFARSVRHVQSFMSAGLEHLIALHMALGGYDYDEFPIEALPPIIGARDDLLQAQVRDLQSQVLVNMQKAGLDLTVDPAWILRTFLNMEEELSQLPDEMVARIFKDIPVDAGAGGDAKGPSAPSGVSSSEWAKILREGTARTMANIRELTSLHFEGGFPYALDHPTFQQIRAGLYKSVPAAAA